MRKHPSKTRIPQEAANMNHSGALNIFNKFTSPQGAPQNYPLTPPYSTPNSNHNPSSIIWDDSSIVGLCCRSLPTQLPPLLPAPQLPAPQLRAPQLPNLLTPPLTLDIPCEEDFLPQQQRILDDSAIIEAGGPTLVEAAEVWNHDEAGNPGEVADNDKDGHHGEATAGEATEAALVEPLGQATEEAVYGEYEILPGFRFARQPDADRYQSYQTMFYDHLESHNDTSLNIQGGETVEFFKS